VYSRAAQYCMYSSAASTACVAVQYGFPEIVVCTAWGHAHKLGGVVVRWARVAVAVAVARVAVAVARARAVAR
jgi:hypothetical protein